MIEEEQAAEDEARAEKAREEKLVTAIDQELRSALGEGGDKLSEQRADAMSRYLGEPYGDEEDDRSSVVTREVLDTIEWIKPELMKLFSSGGDTVRFEPQGPTDVEQAQQETDYINYLVHRRNPGFRIVYEWITDGLLQKLGTVKAYYDSRRTKTKEEYRGLSDTELMMLASRDDIEVLQHQSYDAPGAQEQKDKMLQQMQQQLQMQAQQNPQAAQQMEMQVQQLAQQPLPQAHDVVVRRMGKENGITIENVPPEEFIISKQRQKSIQHTPFCAHRRRMPISELREMGHDISDDIGEGDASINDELRLARHDFDGTDPLDDPLDGADETMRLVWVTEAYIRMDYDEDGIAELRRVLKVGTTVLENEETDCIPFAVWTPIILPHKTHGLSMADLVMDLQRLSSQLFRNQLDNQYLSNNGKYIAVDGMVNFDDLQSSRPHGIVRAKMVNAVQRIDTPQLGQASFQMMAHVDQLRERRTGVSERTQGLDPNQLGSNTAASAVNQVMTAAQQRIELIARVFAETGLTDLFRLLHKLVLQHQTSKDIFRLRDKYVEVDPSSWHERMDTAVVVGLGNGSREAEMMQLNLIFQNQMQLMANPATAGIVTAANIYNTLEDQVKVFDKAAAGRHFTDPASPEAQQVIQAQQQQQQQLQQLQMQLEDRDRKIAEMGAQTKAQKVVLDDQRKGEELQIKRDAQSLDVREHDERLALDTAELAAEIELEKQQRRGVDVGA